MRTRKALFGVLWAAFVLVAAPAHAAERRIALVIGEAAYGSPALGRLTGTRGDADRMQQALGAAGFEIVRRDDLKDKDALRQAVSDFARRLADGGGETVGFLYYSGHGMADARRGANFLIPTGADIRSAVDLPLYALPMDDVLDAVESAGAKAVFVVFDACRSTPGAISRGGRGLLPMRGRSDTLIAFSTAPGETAADDGLYASVLAEELRRPGSESTTLFQRVQNVVAKRTERQQIPQFTSSLVETVQFVAAVLPVVPVVPAAAAVPRDPADEDARDWASAFRTGTRAAFAGYLARHSGGLFAAEAQRRIAAFDQPAPQIAAVPTTPPHARQDPYARWGLTEREFGLLGGPAILQRVDAGTRLPDVIAAAEGGDAVAQTLRGIAYFNGVGGPQDYVEAIRWFRKAAALGQPSSMNYLGHCFHYGLGVRQDYAEAMRWYLKAANLGAPFAYNAIGILYYRGQGVRLDYAEALRWYRRAADLGEPGAMYNVGFQYSNGQGVPVDFAEARRWYEKSAALGQDEAKRALQDLTAKGH